MREGDDNLKKSRLYKGTILLLYFIGWIIVYTSKFIYIQMATTLENYIYCFNWQSIIVAVVILIFPYEKLFLKYKPEIKFKIYGGMYIIINIMLAIYLESNCIFISYIDFVLVTGFIAIMFLLKVLMQTQFSINVKLIIGSCLIALNYINMLLFTEKFSIAFLMSLLHVISLCLMLVNNYGKMKRIIALSIIEIGCGVAVMYFTGHISKYFEIFNTTVNENLLDHPFLRINKTLGEYFEVLCILVVIAMIVLMAKQTKYIYDSDRICGIILGGTVCLIASINIYNLIADLLFPEIPCYEISGFNNKLILPLLAFILKIKREKGEIRK